MKTFLIGITVFFVIIGFAGGSNQASNLVLSKTTDTIADETVLEDLYKQIDERLSLKLNSLSIGAELSRALQR